MAESLQTPTHQASNFNQHSDRREAWREFAEVSPSPLPIQGLDVARGELATQLSTCVRLDWEDLQCFEVVNRQFHQWGVEFANAIALRPSNTAYPAYSGMMVIMGAPKDGWLEATFLRPVQFVSGFVTSSRRTVLTAFDSNNTPLAKIESPGANLSTHTKHLPNVRLSLHAPNIHRVTFYTFNGHLTLDDFCFSG
ncbi:hypothetical protein C7B61_17605 [filamentous cyanobacterium CCP1]|nr:hypothetical protein C7B76_23400 [filamentous cyanobacterium CCP2]PSB60364.1 hypothetical protein C7B61_17605 [filamentous cyanobacterium CCP1]